MWFLGPLLNHLEKWRRLGDETHRHAETWEVIHIGLNRDALVGKHCIGE